MKHKKLFVTFSLFLLCVYGGIPERCPLHPNELECTKDISCVWCDGNNPTCLPKDKNIRNATAILASCSEMKLNLKSQCTNVVCNECNDTDCLFKTCGLKDGSTSTVANNEAECDAEHNACYWCVLSDGNGEGVCKTKLEGCDELRNKEFGHCSSMICVDGNQYDGALLTANQKLTIIVARIIMASFSLLGSVFIIFTMLWFKRLHATSFRLIFFLSCCNLFEAIANLFSAGVYQHELDRYGLCYAQGALLQFSSVSAFGWITSIAVNVYIVVVWGINNKKIEYVYHGLVWGFALLASILPATTKAYGIAGLWCWLTWDNGQIWRWAVYYVPLVIMMLVVAVMYAAIAYTVSKRLKDVANDYKQEEGDNLRKKLRAYPLIFVLCYIFSIINRIYDWASPNDSFFLYLISSITETLVGFINAIVYGLDEETRGLWKKQLFDWNFCVQWTTPYAGSTQLTELDDEVDFESSE